MYGIYRKAARLREAQISAGLEVWHAVHGDPSGRQRLCVAKDRI